MINIDINKKKKFCLDIFNNLLVVDRFRKTGNQKHTGEVDDREHDKDKVVVQGEADLQSGLTKSEGEEQSKQHW